MRDPSGVTRAHLEDQRNSVSNPGSDEVIRDAAIRAKVGRIIELPPESSKSRWALFSSNQLVNLAVGFILTGAIGTWLTTCYQSVADAHKREAEVRETRRSERLKTLDSVGAVLNEGSYRLGRLYGAKENQEPQAHLLKLWDTLFDFNSELAKREFLDAARLCAHFGAEANRRYGDVVQTFHGLSYRIRPTQSEDTLQFRNDYLTWRTQLFNLTTYLAVAANNPSLTDSTSGCRLPPSGFGPGGRRR